MNKPGFDHPAEWVSFVDPEDGVTYHFEWTFLCSGLTCIYGSGCKGLHGVGQQGCCGDGVYFIDNADRDKTLKLAKWMADIDPDMWEQRPKSVTKNTIFEYDEEDDSWKTLRTDKGCIFLNSTGCALHQWSMKYDEDPDDNKPLVCTAVPMQVRQGDDGHDVWIGSFDNERWYQEHQDNEHYADWYCLEDRAAYKAHTPFFQRYKKAIVAQIPERMYQEFERWYIQRLGQSRIQVTKLKPTGNGWRS